MVRQVTVQIIVKHCWMWTLLKQQLYNLLSHNQISPYSSVQLNQIQVTSVILAYFLIEFWFIYIAANHKNSNLIYSTQEKTPTIKRLPASKHFSMVGICSIGRNLLGLREKRQEMKRTESSRQHKIQTGGKRKWGCLSPESRLGPSSKEERPDSWSLWLQFYF